MNLVGLIAKNTIQKEWRSKTLLFLLVTTVLIVLLASVGLSYVKNNVLTDSPLLVFSFGALTFGPFSLRLLLE